MTFTLVLVFVLALVAGGRAASNNFDPVVRSSSGSQIGFILEESPAETYVRDQQLVDNVHLIVTDPDLTPGDPAPRYVFTTVPGSAFRVDSDGFIRSVLQPLDFETSSKYFFSVIVTEDDTVERRSSTLSFTVTVVDVNDHAPVFLQSIYNVTVPEGLYLKGSSSGPRYLATVQAIDVDSEVFGQVSYSISSVYPPNKGLTFDVSPQGLVYLQAYVRVGQSFVVMIRASDGGSPPLSNTTLLVGEVVPDGNRPPEFQSSTYTVFVSEGVLLNSKIWTVPATDPDGDVLEYSILSGNIGGAFQLSWGILSNVEFLDREQVASYSLLISVKDTSYRTATTTLSVVVTDVNDNSPRFVGTVGGRYNFSVLEHPPLGAVIGTVSATDADKAGTDNSRISYWKMYDSSFSFAVNDKTGAIMATSLLDSKTQKQHVLVVRASDGGSGMLSDTAIVIINVVGFMDTVPTTASVPVFPVSYYNTSVPEDVPSNTVLFTLSAVAPAGYSGSISYEIMGTNIAPFSLIRTTGKIIVMTDLDYESKNEYAFLVTTNAGRNSSVPSATATVHVKVVDVNDNAPVFLGPSVRDVTVVEDAPAGLTIANLTATDRDSADSPNGQVRYSIQSVDPFSTRRLFTVDSRSGRLSLNESLTMDNNDYYTIRVVARDQGLLSLSSEVVVHVSVIRTTTTRTTTTRTTTTRSSTTTSIPSWENDSADGNSPRPQPAEPAFWTWLRSSEGLLVVVCVAGALVVLLLLAVVCLCVRLRRAARRRQRRSPPTDVWTTPASQATFPMFGGLLSGGHNAGPHSTGGQYPGGHPPEERVTKPLEPSAPLYPSLPAL